METELEASSIFILPSSDFPEVDHEILLADSDRTKDGKRYKSLQRVSIDDEHLVCGYLHEQENKFFKYRSSYYNLQSLAYLILQYYYNFLDFVENYDNKKLHIWIRNQWKPGSKVNIYSDTAQQWVTGTVERIFQDDVGEWLKIKYSMNNKVRFKQLQRFNHSIRPWQPIMSIYVYIYDAITVPTINTSQLQLLDV
eukprot:25737_1